MFRRVNFNKGDPSRSQILLLPLDLGDSPTRMCDLVALKVYLQANAYLAVTSIMI